MLEFFRRGAQRERAKIRRAALDAVRGAGELHRITCSQALVQLHEAQRRVLNENARDLAQKLVVVSWIERAKIFDRLRVNDDEFSHGRVGRGHSQITVGTQSVEDE